VVFTIVSPNHVFLSAVNLVNLFDQSAVFIVLAMGEGFVLLLGEIDLSIGYVAAIGGVVAAQLVQPGMDLPWWLAIIVALLVCGVIGGLHGVIITRLRMPAFIVTLAGYLIWFGVMIIILGLAGGVSITSTVLPDQQALYGIVYAYLPPLVSWIGLVVIVGLLGSAMWFRDAARRRSGLVAPPVGLTVAKIVLMAVAGITVVVNCNLNRGSNLPIVGVPWVVPLVLVVLGIWTFLLERTQFGRHMYAVGGNPEAARRAGVNVSRVRTVGFVLCSLTAGIAGIIYCSQLGGMTTNINGGQLVLYAVAAAVIGGTSLFGGRGRAIHGLLGGLVIGAIYNGLYLLAFPIQVQLIVTGLVLLAAVSVDSLSRKGAGGGSLVRA
jgi:D-xylose transport system permease protein